MTDMTDMIFTYAISNLSGGQDYVKVFKNGAALMDGHGTNGAYYAVETCNEIESRHVSGRTDIESWSEEIDNKLAQQWPLMDGSITIRDGVPMRYGHVIRGGTTATYVSYDPSKKIVTIASAGDSRGYLFTRNEGKVDYLLVTPDHSPLSHKEYLRMESLRSSGLEIGTLVYNVTHGEKIPIYDGNGDKIDYFSEHIKVAKTTEEYHRVTAELALDPTNEEKKALQKLSLKAYHATNKEYMSSANYHYHSRMMIGTVKGEYGVYIASPKNIPSGQETMLSCVCSIGDHHAKKIGARSNWDVSQLSAPSAEKAVLFVASDGVHDCYKEDELAKLVLDTESDEELLSTFVKKSKELFKKQGDDISFFRAFW
jgi:serine/threonine protein phosphatase PrpC